MRGTGEEEKQLKNAKTEYASEAEEIATYTAIETLAEALGAKEIQRTTRAIRREEERMLAFLEKEIPRLTRAVVKAEIPAAQRSLAAGSAAASSSPRKAKAKAASRKPAAARKAPGTRKAAASSRGRKTARAG